MLFNHLLIPVDFTVNTEIAVKKAIELIDTENSIINLLHVVSPLVTWGGYSMYPFHAFTRVEANSHNQEVYKLLQLKMQIAKALPGVIVQIQVTEGGIEESIVKASKALRPELIIIGKHRRTRLLPFFNSISPERIAKKSDCPVFTVKQGALDHKIRSIVVPIGRFVPKRKIELLSVLSKKFHLKIHLVTLIKDSTIISVDTSNALLQTYRLLKGRGLHTHLEHKVMAGNSLAKASLKYAESIMADLLLVNPETETKVSSITGQHITDKLLNDSRLQVLEVKPYPFLNVY